MGTFAEAQKIIARMNAQYRAAQEGRGGKVGNPYHDAKGLFTTAEKAVVPRTDGKVSVPVATKAEDSAMRAALREGKGDDRPFDQHPVEMVPVNRLFATQHEVSVKTVRQYMREGDDGQTPNGTLFKGKYYIQDGHHRIEAAIRKGLKTISMHVDRIKD